MTPPMLVTDQHTGERRGGGCGGAERNSRDHLGMAVLQSTLELAFLGNLLLLDVVDGFFLVVFRHLWQSWGEGGGGVRREM